MGRGISIQCWNLLPKIREVDAWLRRGEGQGPELVESHPELSYARLADEDLGRKATAEGVAARLAVLHARGVNARALLATGAGRLTGVRAAAHDQLDALVLAYCATLPASAMENLPARFMRDSHGLPMRMRVPRITQVP